MVNCLRNKIINFSPMLLRMAQECLQHKSLLLNKLHVFDQANNSTKEEPKSQILIIPLLETNSTVGMYNEIRIYYQG